MNDTATQGGPFRKGTSLWALKATVNMQQRYLAPVTLLSTDPMLFSALLGSLSRVFLALALLPCLLEVRSKCQ